MRLCEHCGAKFTADTGRATCSDRCARKLRNKQVQASMNKVPVFYIHAEIREANMERAETLYAESPIDYGGRKDARTSYAR